MMRAVVGSWVLVLVFTGLVAGSAVLGAGQRGQALRAMPPPPPAVGSCTNGLPDPVIVGCDSAHAGEVVLAWPGDTPLTALDPQRFPPEYFPADDPQSHCWAAAVGFVGQSENLFLSSDVEWWWARPAWDLVVVSGPGTDAVPQWSWSACVLVPLDADGLPAPSTSSLRGAAEPGAALPSVWRSCTTALASSTERVSCLSPHRAELVAGAQIPMSVQDILLVEDAHRLDAPVVDLAHPAAEADCRALAETYLGATLDSFDGELESALSYAGSYAQEVEPGEAPPDRVPTGVAVDCRVQVVGDRTLIDSVAGLGTGPLPYG